MQMSRRGSGPVAPASHAYHGPVHGARSERPGKIRPLIPFLLASLFATSICISTAHAVTFGHSRLVSAQGQPLLLEIPVTQLTQQEIESIRATPAPAEAWRAAGMTPPVPLESMRLLLLDGFRPDVKLIQLRSTHAVEQPVIDVLIDVRSVSGQQRFQVSLIAHADTRAIQRAPSSAPAAGRVIDNKGGLPGVAETGVEGRKIVVRPGDNMFAIATRNAVQGVTVYQMMIALQRSNPQAFIHDNVNLVKAGATLTMPSMDVLTALSDREARRIFMQHTQAFARYGQRAGSSDVVAASTVAYAAEGSVQEQPAEPAAPASAPAASQGSDILRLSGTRTPGTVQVPGVRGESAVGAPAGAPNNGGAVGGTAPGGAESATGSARTNGVAASNGFAASNGVDGTTGMAASGGVATGAAGSGSGPVGLLASSGVIASDAVTHSSADALASDKGGGSHFGSEASSGGSAVAADGSILDPDDEAARQKRIEESKNRIIELEDNVRHLNEALQKQGHVAAEAALEGARSVTEVIKEVIGLVGSESDGSSAENVRGGTEPGQTSSPSSSASTAGQGSTPAAAFQSGASSSGAGVAAVRQGGADISSGQGAADSRNASQVEGKSWWQQNLFGVVGAGIALLVLLAVWLLRRVSAAREERLETDSPISDSMLQEKLREIDLDLNNPPDSGRRGS